MLGWLLGGFILFILGVVPIMAVICGSKAEKRFEESEKDYLYKRIY